MTPFERIVILAVHERVLFCSFLLTVTDQLSFCNTAVKGRHRRSAMFAQKVNDGLHRGLRMKIFPRLRRKQQARVPASMKLHTSTTCCRLPSRLSLAGTVLTSLKSIWISSKGFLGSRGCFLGMDRSRIQPCLCKIFHTVRVERGKGTCKACNSSSRGR